MKHIIISTYQSNLPQSIVEHQKKVFNYFNIPLEQIMFKQASDMHSFTMSEVIKARDSENWDFFTFFDIDCVPIKPDAIEKAVLKIEDGLTLYGNAQASNTTEGNLVKTPPFAAPSFLNISRLLWEKYKKNYPNYINEDIFKFRQKCCNPDGEISECDVAEEFTKENKKINNKIELAYPTKVYGRPDWSFDGGWGYESFKFGNYTEFESDTFHNFQIRDQIHQEFFINYCKGIINEN